MNGIPHNFISYGRQVASGARQIKKLNLSSLRKVFSLMGKKEKIALLTLLAIGALGLVKLIFSGLYKHDGQGNLIPDLAESLPQISEDQKQYTVALKKNAQWHNGKIFNAGDVVFTILTIKDPNFKSPLRSSWASTNVEKLDDFTLRFTTKEVSGPFINNLTLPILSESLWGKTNPGAFALSESNLKAIGTGFFAVKEIKKLSSGKVQSITLESFSGHFAGKAKIDEITLKFYDQPEDLINALHSREIEGFGYLSSGENLNLDPQRESVNLLKLPLPQYQVVFFNYENKHLKEQRVRAALSKLVSRGEILQSAWRGNAKIAYSLFDFYSGSQNGRANSRKSDLIEAMNLLEGTGYKKNLGNGFWEKNKEALELRLFTNDFLPNARAAESLAQNFKNFGIKIVLNIVPNKQLSDNYIKPRNFDILVFTQKFGPDPDPFAFWHSSQTKDPGLNLSGFKNLEADKLLTAARTTADQEVRQEKYEQLDGLLKAQMPVVFLNQAVYTYALDKNIKGASM